MFIHVVRVLARSLKMPVQNGIYKISARQYLATQLLQILIPTTFYSPWCPKGQSICQLHFIFEGLLGKDMVINSKTVNNINSFCLSKKEFFMKLPVLKTVWTSPGWVLHVAQLPSTKFPFHPQDPSCPSLHSWCRPQRRGCSTTPCSLRQRTSGSSP